MSAEYTQAFISSVSLQIICPPNISCRPPFISFTLKPSSVIHKCTCLTEHTQVKSSKVYNGVCSHFCLQPVVFLCPVKKPWVLFFFSVTLPDWLSHCIVCHWRSDILWLCWWNCASFQPGQPALHLHSASSTQPGHGHCHGHWRKVSSQH